MQDQTSNIKDKNLTQKPKIEVKYRAFYLSIKVIKFVESLPYKQSLRIINDQLIRCITSVGANIVEAKSSSSKREFVNYFQIALKSSNETKYWLALLKEIYKNDTVAIDQFVQEISEKSKILGSSILTMKGKKQL